MELCALINIQDPVSRRLAVPHSVLQEAFDSVENDLEYAETTAQPLPRQQISLPGYLSLLSSTQLLYIWHYLKGSISKSER